MRGMGVRPVACFVDDVYYVSGGECEGLPIIEKSRFMQDKTDKNIVIGFNSASLTHQQWSELQARAGRGRVMGIIENNPLISDNAISSMFVKEHMADFEEIFNLLCDDESRQVLLAYLRAKANCFNAPDTPRLDELWKEDAYINSLTKNSALGLDQGIIIDCGAYDGDTAESFAKLYPSCPLIYALEPDNRNYEKLKDKCLSIPMLKPIKKGAWSETTVLQFNEVGTQSSTFSKGGSSMYAKVVEVPVIDIDSLIESNGRVSFIKMDIEGSEAEAIRGAKHVIARDMPVLAVCVYHRCRDLIDLPKLIILAAGHKQYDFYLRAHSFNVTDIVLYAIPHRMY